ncbi:MAG: RNA-binding S4 domain-containing protein, partial [Pseudomonadota bacterium]
MIDGTGDVRLDKWLWAARLFKTRSLAAEAADRGRVLVNGQVARPSRAVRPGDILTLRLEGPPRVLQVRGLSRLRGPAAQAQALYEETPDSLAARARAAEARRLAPEPAAAIAQG